jgi:hypothetical protein
MHPVEIVIRLIRALAIVIPTSALILEIILYIANYIENRR